MYTFKASGYGVDSARVDGATLNRITKQYREFVENSRFNDPAVAQRASPLSPPENKALYGSAARKGQKATSYILLLLRPQPSEHLFDRMGINTDEVLIAYCGDNSFVRVKQRCGPNVSSVSSLEYIAAVVNRELTFSEWTAVSTERGRETGREVYHVADTRHIGSTDFRSLDRAVTIHSVTWGNGIQMEAPYGPLFRGMNSPVSVSLAPVPIGVYRRGREQEDLALVATTLWYTQDNLGRQSDTFHNALLFDGRAIEGRILEVPDTLIVGTFQSVEGRARLFTPDTDLSKVVKEEVTSTDSRTLRSSGALVDFHRQLVGSPKPGPTYAQRLLDAMETKHRELDQGVTSGAITDEYEIDKLHNLGRMLQQLRA